jgi:hypothetical protein
VSRRELDDRWLSGIEDRPERSGEICVPEIFGDAVRPGTSDVGMGLHRFRDPSLTEEFSAERLTLDFPAKADPDAPGPPPVPELVVSRVRGHPLG